MSIASISQLFQETEQLSEMHQDLYLNYLGFLHLLLSKRLFLDFL